MLRFFIVILIDQILIVRIHRTVQKLIWPIILVGAIFFCGTVRVSSKCRGGYSGDFFDCLPVGIFGRVCWFYRRRGRLNFATRIHHDRHAGPHCDWYEQTFFCNGDNDFNASIRAKRLYAVETVMSFHCGGVNGVLFWCAFSFTYFRFLFSNYLSRYPPADGYLSDAQQTVLKCREPKNWKDRSLANSCSILC